MGMDQAFQDVRYAARRLRRSPAFAAAAIATLALGIGANALIFSAVSAVFLRPLSYPDAARLVWATEFFPKFNRSMALAPDYAAWKRDSAVFERLEAMGSTLGTNLVAGGRPAQRVQTARVTPGFFHMLGILPRLGPGFDSSGRAPSAATAIVSDQLWRGYLAADPGIAGKTVLVNGKPLTVVGVMPPGLVYPDGPDIGLWTPDAVSPEATVPGRRPQSLRVIGRLKAGVSVEQARAELDRIARGMDKQYPTPWSQYHAAAAVRVISLQKQLTADSATATAVLMGAVGFLLLIACANVANLFLARAVARRKEIAMRAAVGASRGDIVRLLLAESLLLAAAGGTLGMALLYWGRQAVAFLIPKALAQGIPIDWRVLAFTAVCTLSAGLLFGLMPALSAARVDVNPGLKETAVSSGGRLAGALAAGQIALSLVLAVGAGLLIRSFLILASTHPGFDYHDVLTATVMLRPLEAYGPAKQVEFFDRLLDGISRLPGLHYSAVTSSPPMAQFSALESGLRADNGPETSDTVSLASVSAEYFQTLGIPLLSGRFFDARDGQQGTPVAIVNQTLAKRFFPGRDAVGHRINARVTIVGVVADVRHRALDDQVWPELFLPFEQSPSPWITVIVRGAKNPSPLADSIRGVARSIDAAQPLFDVELLEERVNQSLATRRERASILGVFAGLAVLIAAVGVYGVVSCRVARRTQEFGIRMALGAGRGDVLRLVVNSGLRVALWGMAIGVAGAMALARLLKTFLYGIEPADLATFIAACGILAAAALLASYLPARRAAAVDPMVALRGE